MRGWMWALSLLCNCHLYPHPHDLQSSMGRAASAEHRPDGCEEDSKGDWESEAEIIMEDTSYMY